MDRRYLLLLLLIAALCFWLAPSLGTAPKAPAPVNHSTSSLFGRPSVSVAFINTVLSAYHSPASGSGQALYDDGVRYGVDPAYALGFFLHESTFRPRGVARQPRSRGPRLTSAPSLLGGLVRCDCKKSYALSTATGTSRNGTIYSYYKCVQGTKRGSQCGAAGTCANRKIARPLIERLVVDALVDKLLTPERVNAILVALKSRRDGRQASADRRISELAKQALR